MASTGWLGFAPRSATQDDRATCNKRTRATPVMGHVFRGPCLLARLVDGGGGSGLFAQDLFLDLAGGGLGQLGEHHGSGGFEVGQARPGVLDKLRFSDLRAWLELH